MDIKTLRRTVGAVLLEARGRVGLTQAEVAARVGIAPAVYGRIERGQMLPSVPTMHRLCVTLSVTSDVLLGLGSERRAARSTPVKMEDSPELRRLESTLRTLSPAALRALTALAAVVGR